MNTTQIGSHLTAHRHFQQIVDRLDIGLGLFLQNDKVCLLNSRFLNIFDIENSGAVTGLKSMLAAVGPKVLNLDELELMLSRITDHTFDQSEAVLQLVGNRWITAKCQKVSLDQDGDSQILIQLFDITQSQRNQDLISIQRSQLLESHRLKAVGELAACIAHEINNPMTVIYGRATWLFEMAKKSTIDAAQTEKATTQILTVAKRVTKIIASLRNLSKDSGSEPVTATVVPEVIAETLTLVENRLKTEGVELRWNPLEEQGIAKCHPIQTSQIILNLINNALDAVSKEHERWIQIECFSAFEDIVVAVSDSGPGITETLGEQIFDAFFTTKPSHSGTGLGLTISRDLARAQNGELVLDTNSKHTRFVLRLPRG